MAPPAATCPTCKKPLPSGPQEHLPFCSERCQLADLGDWLADRYVIPGDPTRLPEEDDEV